MTYHSRPWRTAKGYIPVKGKSSRLTTGYPVADFARAQRLADRLGKPLSQVMRDALATYLALHAPDDDVEGP